MRTPHTPGPWIIGRGYASTHATPVRWEGENLAWVCGTDSAHNFTHAQTAANAALIASAPDLLAALVEVQKASEAAYAAVCGPQDWTPEHREEIRLAMCAADKSARDAIKLATTPKP